MSDEGPSDTEHARVSRQWAIGKLRKLPVRSPAGKIQLVSRNLPLDEMIIVDQPFRRWGYRVPRVDRRGEWSRWARQQHRRVVGEPARERKSLGQLWCHRLRNSQAPRVFLKTLDAEEFFPNGLSIVPG